MRVRRASGSTGGSYVRVDESLKRGKAELHDLVGDADEGARAPRLGADARLRGARRSCSSTRTSSGSARGSSPPRASPTAERARAHARTPGRGAGRKAAPACCPRAADARLAAALAPLHRAGRRRVGARVRGASARKARVEPRASRSARRELGQRRRATSRSSTRASSRCSSHDFERHGNNLGFAYFHGRPGTPGLPGVRRVLRDAAAQRHAEIDRIQVTHREMEELVLGTGVAPEKVHRIPIGIDVDAFRAPVARACRRGARGELGLPESAFVVGSFQKDGVGWGEGLEPKLIKGPGRARRGGRAACASACRELVVLLTGPARGYVQAGLERRGIPYRHALLAERRGGRDGLPGDRRLPRRVAPGGRPEERCSSRWRPACRSSRRASGRRADLVRHGRTAGWSTSRTSTALVGAVGARRRGAAGRARRASRDAGRATAEENSYDGASRRAGARCSTASSRCRRRSERVDLSAHAPAATRAPARAGRGCSSSGRAGARGPRLLRPRPRPGAGRARRPAARRRSRSSPRASRTARRTSRSSTSARRGSRATSARSSGSRAGAGARSSSTRTASRYPGWAGDAHRRAQRAAATRASRAADHVALPERVLQAVGRRVPRRADADRGRSSRTRSTSTASRRPRDAARAGPCCCSAATRRRRTGSSSRCGRSRRSCDAHPDARLLVTGRLVVPIEPLVDELGLRGASTSSAGTRSATRPTSSAARTSSCTRRSTIPCPTLVHRGDGVRASGRLPGERRHGRARRRRGGHRRAASRTAGSATSRRRRRRSPTP